MERIMLLRKSKQNIPAAGATETLQQIGVTLPVQGMQRQQIRRRAG